MALSNLLNPFLRVQECSIFGLGASDSFIRAQTNSLPDQSGVNKVGIERFHSLHLAIWLLMIHEISALVSVDFMKCSTCNIQYVGEIALPLHKCTIHQTAKSSCGHMIKHLRNDCVGLSFSIQIIC